MKIRWFAGRVEACKAKEKKQRDDELFARCVGIHIRGRIRPFNLDGGDAEPVTAENAKAKPYLDSTNWGGTKI